MYDTLKTRGRRDLSSDSYQILISRKRGASKMKYDFESIIDRKNKDALACDVIPIEGAKVQEGFSHIPMWVADMNFATVPTIGEHVIERVRHPLFGYFMPTDEYYGSIISWQKKRHGVEGLTKEDIGYENGVIGCAASALKAFSAPGDPILVHSPTYIGFTEMLDRNGRKIVHSPLVRDKDGIWRMDYDDMDKKIRKNKIHLCIFCSPHNPTGRVWERDEIEKAMEVYKKNDCIVISDEIWSDIILDGNEHITTQSISDDAKMRTIAVYAPSKTFNLAGLIGSYHVIYNKYLRDRLEKVSEQSCYNNMNVLSMHALIGAYTPEGNEWTDELCETITGNVDYACRFIKEHLSGVEFSKPQGTYMLFIDCRKWCADHNVTIDELLRKGVSVGVIWQDGRDFQAEGSIRLNLALPKALLVEAFDRLEKYVF